MALAVVATGATIGFIWLTDLSGPAQVGLLAVAGVAYLGLLWLRPTNDALPIALVVGLSVLLTGAAVAKPPQGTDLWAYQMYGRTVATYDASPYRTPPKTFAGDPVLERMQGSWVGNKAEYGPALVGTAVVVSATTGTNEAAGRLAWQGLMAASMLGAMALLWRRTQSSLAVALVGCSPVVGYQLVHLAHNDAMIGLAVLAGVILAADRRHMSAALLLTIAALIKAPSGLALVALGIWLWRRRGWRPALQATAVSAVAGIGAVALAGGVDAIGPMLGARGRTNTFTPWNLFRGGGAIFTGDSMPDLPFVASEGLGTVALVVAIALTVLVIVGRSMDAEASLASVVGAGLAIWTLLALYTSPWSIGWALPVLALRPRSVLTRLVLTWATVFAVVAQWGILTVAATWLEQPNAGLYDDVNALGKSLLLMTLLGVAVAITVDALRRPLRTDPDPHEVPRGDLSGATGR